MTDRASWLLDVHQQAEALIAEDGFEDRFSAFLREDQHGRWGLDGVSGYYWYLHALVAVVRPKKVLELGRCLGTSTLFILGALEAGAMLISVDIHEQASDLAHMSDDQRLQSLIGNDLDLATYDGIDIAGIDFLFVDTDHTYAQATKEWVLYRPFLADNTLVVFDDITMNDMGRFWDELPCAKFATGTTYHYTGFGIAAP
jgi:cephalosporin hydroxylase